MPRQRYDPRSHQVQVLELYLPCTQTYDVILKNTLEQFFDSKKLRANETLKELMESWSLSAKAEVKFLKLLMDIVAGYSMYQVDGAFRMGDGQIASERSNVVRLIIRPIGKKKLSEQDKKLILFVAQHLICGALAKATKKEMEVWSIEYSDATLYRWVKQW